MYGNLFFIFVVTPKIPRFPFSGPNQPFEGLTIHSEMLTTPSEEVITPSEIRPSQPSTHSLATL